MSKQKEHYENQFKPCTVPLRGSELKHFQNWYCLIIKAAFASGITTGW